MCVVESRIECPRGPLTSGPSHGHDARPAAPAAAHAEARPRRCCTEFDILFLNPGSNPLRPHSLLGHHVSACLGRRANHGARGGSAESCCTELQLLFWKSRIKLPNSPRTSGPSHGNYARPGAPGAAHAVAWPSRFVRADLKTCRNQDSNPLKSPLASGPSLEYLPLAARPPRRT